MSGQWCLVMTVPQENLAASCSCQCCIAVLFWLFFKKIINNSKSVGSVGSFDLILILLGALAHASLKPHFSQDMLF